MVIALIPRENSGGSPSTNRTFASHHASDKEKQTMYSSSGLKCLKDCVVLRGMCYGVSWAGEYKDGEILAIIDPPQKLQENKRKTLFGSRGGAKFCG